METAGQQDNVRRVPRVWLALLAVYALALGLAYLGSWPLVSHENMAALRTQGLMQEGHGVLPYLDGQPDPRKPPLGFWMVAGLSRVVGEMNEWTVRLPSVLAALGVMLLVVYWVSRLAGGRAGLVAGLATATSVMVLDYGRSGLLDMELTFWTALAVTGYWRALAEEDRRRRLTWAWTMWLAVACGVLTKGPITPLVLLSTAAVVAALYPEGRRIGRLAPVAGPLAAAAVVAAWVVPAYLSYPHFFEVWRQQTLGRMGGEVGNAQPFWYYAWPPACLIFCLPWVLPLVIGVYRALRHRQLSRLELALLAAWGIVGIVLLSLSSAKMRYYVLPMMPPWLIFAGLGLSYLVYDLPQKMSRVAKAILAAHWLLVPAAVGAGFWGAHQVPEWRWQTMSLGLAAGAVVAVVLALYGRGRRAAALVTLAVGLLVLWTAVWGGILAPLAWTMSEEAAIGRYIREQGIRQESCVYQRGPWDYAAPYYAGRELTNLETPAEVRQWRAAHPSGYVMVRVKAEGELAAAGAWETVSVQAGQRPKRFPAKMVLLKATEPAAR
jgi:4-amino-4-deoxy-L-arabinose transferase-like glycosyltransferase